MVLQLVVDVDQTRFRKMPQEVIGVGEPGLEDAGMKIFEIAKDFGQARILNDRYAGLLKA
ncbi:hypothetical protein AV541_06310 [Thermus parvatiensis]|uniref:Uncharacterized protein n=1 Tax=Thermus parvatiensis TaxID=456163 RepID=A0A0X8D8C9_9DEIN|nr:hypothetical protein AV541_06310 [Thermus parvatiensis]